MIQFLLKVLVGSILFFLLIPPQTISQENNHREPIDPEAFSVVEFALRGELNITAGKTRTIKVQANDYVLNHIQFSVLSGVLTIRLKGSPNNKNLNSDIYVIMGAPAIDELRLTKKGIINAYNIKSKNLTCVLEGPGTILVNGQTERVNFNVKGTGKIKMIGKGNNVTSSIQGSGQIDLSELDCVNAESVIIGSGNIIYKNGVNINSEVEKSGDIIFPVTSVFSEKYTPK